MKIKNLIRVVATSLVWWLRFGSRRHNAPAPPPEQLDLGLDPITETGLRLHKALPVRSAEYWPPAEVHAPFSTAAKKFPRTKAPGSASNTKHLKEAFVPPPRKCAFILVKADAEDDARSRSDLGGVEIKRNMSDCLKPKAIRLRSAPKLQGDSVIGRPRTSQRLTIMQGSGNLLPVRTI